jgi:hypothetical protein
MFPIASGYATNIYTGSVVAVIADGSIAIATATGMDATTNAFPDGSSHVTGVIGVFMGCTYTSPSTKQKMFSQYWPTGTVASDALAYVVDDDRVIFQAQCDATVAATALGSNTGFAAAQSTSTGSTATGNSTSALDATVQTGSAAFRIVGFVDKVGFSVVGDTYTDVLVRFNPGYHSNTCAVGI